VCVCVCVSSWIERAKFVCMYIVCVCACVVMWINMGFYTHVIKRNICMYECKVCMFICPLSGSMWYVYTCVYMHTYKHARIHTYIHACIHVHRFPATGGDDACYTTDTKRRIIVRYAYMRVYLINIHIYTYVYI
jgi:hypothetical protein